MKKRITPITVIAAFALTLIFINIGSANALDIGKEAPDFTATDIHGNKFKLSDYRGKNIILEWTNHKCPFVRKHYESGNMQKTQELATKNGAIWISIVSSCKGKQGYVTPEEAIEIEKRANAHSTHRILDENGEIGHLYGAKTTPNMFIINDKGILVYEGAIDSVADTNPESIKKATNYVLKALDDLNSGKEVEIPATAPYGCAIKYKTTK